MKNSSLSLIAVIAVSLVSACEAEPTASTDSSSQTSSKSLTSVPNETAWAQGTNWSYESNFAGFPNAWVYRPVGFSKKVSDRRGAVIHLIGCGQMPYQVAQGAGWPKVAEEYGYVIVVPEIVAPIYPNAAAKNIACYSYGSSTMPSRTTTDHKTIIAAATKLVSERPELKIDSNQIYLSGLSAGGAVAMQVACMAPNLFSGVGVMAGPAMGTNQSTAVMPPTINADKVKSQCTTYAKSGSLSDPLTTLAETTWVIVSDNNGLPAGNAVLVDGVWTAEKFRKQTIWDGDKFCPYANHTLVSSAIPSLLKATKSGSKLTLPFSGTGTGCAGGEASHDDTAETECTFAKSVTRSWVAQADVWKNAAGATRLVWVTQDTLRHRWPTGPLNSMDREITPNRQWMINDGYILANGQFDDAKVAAGPNGALGALYFAPDAFSLPAYLAETWNENNPRIVPNAVVFTVSAAASVNGANVTISGAATPGANASSVSVMINGVTKNAALTAGEPATYTVDFAIDHVGKSTAIVTATSTSGVTAEATVEFTIKGSGDNAPVIDSAKAVFSGTTVTVTGTAHDDDEDLDRVEIVVGIAGSICTGTSTFTCVVDLGTKPPEGEHTVNLIATDAKDHTASLEVTYTVPPPGSAPVIDTAVASVSGSTLKVTGTAHDVDNDLSKVEIAVIGMQPLALCTGTSSFSCSMSTTGWGAGSYTATVIATDAAGATSHQNVDFTIAAKASCVTAKNSVHVSAGRAHMGTFYTTSAFANGTNQYLGYAGPWVDSTTSIQEQSAGSWALVSSCP